jgi:CubicO group peptidase (beta-lactamase class C family)
MTDQRRIVEIMDKGLRSGGPGMAYIVADAAGPIFERAGGLADISGRVPLALTTTLAAFSMTKTLTAIAVLQLAMAGALRLDDKVSEHIAHPYDPGITIRQLITHTSGLPNPIPLRWVHGADVQAGFDGRAALAAVLAKHGGQRSRPGDRYLYSNIGYWLLGEVVEAASKQDYAAFVRARVFSPLGLSPQDIDFAIAEPRNHAKGYLAAFSPMNFLKRFLLDRGVWGDYEGSWLRICDVYPDGPSFGGAIGSAAAFSVILRDLLKEDPVLLSKASRALLFEQARLNSGRTIDMTLGWHIGRIEGRPYYFKEGGGAGFHCEMRMYPAQGLASVIMVNRTSFNSNRFLSRLDRESADMIGESGDHAAGFESGGASRSQQP